MRDLRLQLDDTDFAQLVETARSLIPTLAPTWTDHNIHDPGITLLDLTAWTAEAQIYSLGRMRRDERAAYGDLVGVTPSGPLASSGLIWPALAVIPDAGVSLPSGTLLRGTRNNTPSVSLQRSTFLTGARLTRVTAVLGDGTARDWTRTNLQQAGSFAAFGEADTGAAALTLHFTGRLADPAVGIPANHELPIGVRLAGSAASMDAPAASVGVQAILQSGAQEYPLPLRLDTTGGLLRTGVLSFDVSGVDLQAVVDFTITLRSSGGDFVRAPQVVRIAPNVLLVEGRQRVRDEQPDWGTGLPNQRFELRQAGLQFGADVAPPVVAIASYDGFQPWHAVPDLSLRGPQETVYFVDAARGVLVFGNGINGAVPPLGATLRVDYWISSGALGNVPRGVQWQFAENAAVFGANPDPLAGGAEATTLEDLQRAARERVRTEYPLVTVTDLEQAALALPDLQVARARELPDLGPQCGFAELAGVRTLVALATRTAQAAETPPEHDSWLLEIQRRLAPRVPLGQRLQVTAPKYLPVRVRVVMRARPQTDPEQLRLRVVAELRQRFVLVGEGAWPFERDVKQLDLQGWLRKVPGVGSILQLQLLLNEVPAAAGSIAVHGRALPLLRLAAGDVSVARAAGAQRP